MGELVTIKDAYAVSRPNQYGDVWVRGDWKVTGQNEQGGLTMSDGGMYIPTTKLSQVALY